MATLTVGKNTVCYTRTCRTSNPANTLVLLHGWQGSAKSWEPNISELSQKFDCIAIDFPGFGKSPTPAEIWGISDYADFVRTFVKELSLSKVTLVGKSFGGRVAIYYAHKWPQALSHLILVAAAGVERKGLGTMALITLAKFGKKLLTLLGVKHSGGCRKLFHSMAGVTPDESSYKWEVKKKVTNNNLTKHAATIEVPTLIVWGDQDEILPLKWGKKLQRLIRNSTLRQIPGGHNAHAENATEFDKILEGFLLKS